MFAFFFHYLMACMHARVEFRHGKTGRLDRVNRVMSQIGSFLNESIRSQVESG